MSKKKNPFLTWKREYKGKGKYWTCLRMFGPILYGRLYDYRYRCKLDCLKENGFVSAFPDRGPVKPYDILLSQEEIDSMNKQKDVNYFFNLFEREDGKKLVGFTEEEFKNFRRTVIIDYEGI